MKLRALSVLVCLPFIVSGAAPNIKNIGIENGLSNNYVVSITQDGSGMMWIATENGLNRFDGNGFRHFLKNEIDGRFTTISGNELNKVYADLHDPLIWVATQRSGLNMYDTRTGEFCVFRHSEADPGSIVTDDITDLVNSADGNLWVSTYHVGVDYYDKQSGKFTHYNRSTVPLMPSDHVWTVREDMDGRLYIGHVDKGMTVLSLKDNTVKNFQHDPEDYSSLPGNSVRSICLDENGGIWVGTNNGLALFDPSTDKFTVFRHDPANIHSLGADYIYTINRLSDNRLWIGTENGGVSILDLRQVMFTGISHVRFERIVPFFNSGLSEKTVRTIYEDTFGNIWLGTYGGGVDFISHLPRFFDSWRHFASPPGQIPSVGLTNKIAWGITVDTNGYVWVGTDGDGINVFRNGRRIMVLDTENGIADNAILSAITTRSGDLWFGTYSGGVSVWEPATRRFVRPFRLPAAQARCIYEDDGGNVWIGTNEGLFRWSAQEMRLDEFRNGLPEGDVRAVCQDAEGNIWVGTFGQGLAVFNPSMELIQVFNTRNKLRSNTINHMYRDNDDNLWIATGEGLILQRAEAAPGEFIIYGMANGLSNSHVRAIIQDLKGNIWFSTSSGISRYVPSQARVYNYNRFDGVPAGEFMSGSVAMSADGMIYFGSQNGVCFFDPDQVPLYIDLPPTLIPLLKIYDTKAESSESGKEIPVSGHVTLKYTQNTFDFFFHVPDFAFADIVQYEYRMRGIDDKWYPAAGSNCVTFRSVRPGKYTFDVRTRVNNQMWDARLSSVEVTILPPFWKTWWFKALYISAITLFIFSMNRFYRRKLALENSLELEKASHLRQQEMNDERLRFFTNVTHELRTPLTLILGPLEDMKSDNSLTDEQKQKIGTIYKSSNRLLSLINQILEFRKTETRNKKLAVRQGDLAALVVETSLKYKELNGNGEVVVETFIESENNEMFFDPEVITMIMDNLISNALKYTDTGSVGIYLRDVHINDRTYAEIEVADTGRGMDKESLGHIFERYYQVDRNRQHSGTGIGLALVHNLVTLHEGEITVDSMPRVGTSFRVRILKDNTYPGSRTSASDSGMHESDEELVNAGVEGRNIILVIEDNQEIREYIAESLSDSYTVKTASDGDEGQRTAFEIIPDIVITDIMMPGTDGITLCKLLKEDVRTSHIPVIMLTARDTIHDKTQGYEAGADSYITKPFSSRLLKTRIDNILEGRRRTAAAVNSNTAVKNNTLIESIGKIDNEFIEKITGIIEGNMESEKTDVNFIAEKMCMSHSTLYRKIKALTGMTTNEFIRKVRIRNAEKLLLTGRYNISEVSFMVGINSITYFRQCFRDEFGVSPSEYIRNIKSAASARESADDRNDG